MNYIILFLYTGFVSIISGLTGLLLTWQWYPIADMLRGLSVASLVFALLMLLPAKAAVVFVCLLFIPYLFFTVVNVFHFINYGSTITAFAIQSILETSSAEARELIFDHLTVSNILSIGAVAALSILLLRLACKAAKNVKRNKITVAASVLIVLAMLPVLERKNGKVLRYNVELTFIKGGLNYRSELEHIKGIRAARNAFTFPGLEFVDAEPDAERSYVFVIGESSNRHHFSLYGYWRETNPRLSAISDELFIFTDAISYAPYTVPSLRNAFLFADNAYDSNVIINARSLINLFNAAGFETFWISNQTVNADRLTGAAILAGDAKHRQFFNLADDESKTVLYDGVLLAPLEEVLNQPYKKKAIFLHTIGSHMSYKLRYPAEFEKFANPDDVPITPWREAKVRRYVNEYDNSILYTDYLVTSIIDTVKKRSGQNFVLYFSDHGQDVYDTKASRGQNANTPTHHMYDIPFILWLSHEYKVANPALVSRIQNALDKPFYLPHLPSTASELAHLKHEAFEPEKSVVNANFKVIERTVFGVNASLPYRSLLQRQAGSSLAASF